MDRLAPALDLLARSLQSEAGGRVRFKPFLAARGGTLQGEFEVRSADGHVRRMQPATLPLPAPLARGFAHLAPCENEALDLGTHRLTLWAPQELIELQVGFRWHGFTGRRMPEWDERYVVFAEDGGDPVALRTDEPDGPVWLSHRGEGRHTFWAAAPDLATFYEVVAIWLQTRREGTTALEGALSARFGVQAAQLWLWKQLVSRVDARR